MSSFFDVRRSLTFAVIIIAIPSPARGVEPDKPVPPLTIRLVQPGEQIQRVVDLFDGTRFPHPAGALAAWIHAHQGKSSLGRPIEAAITLFNPRMARELRSLNDAEFQLVRFEPGSGQARWRAFLPEDDGSFTALTTAITLTDGAADQPIDDIAVMRLGGQNSPVSASLPDRFIVASDRDELRVALKTRDGRPVLEQLSGVYLQLDPSGLSGSTNLNIRRFVAGLEALGCQESKGRLGLEGETLTLKLTSTVDPTLPTRATIDPTWLDPIPAQGTVAAFALAIEPTPGTINAAFALADRIEKADPLRAEVAPIRTRINLLAAVARVRPDVDVWPRMRGISGFVLADPNRAIGSGVLVLHTVDARSAKRLVEETLPKILSTYTKPKPDAPAKLTIEGRSVRAESIGADVWLSWGEQARTAGLEAASDPTHSAGTILRAGWGASLPERAGAFWPGRVGSIATPNSDLARAFERAQPIFWVGRVEGKSLRDEIRWSGLRGLVKGVLDALPMEAPPDH